MAVGSLQKINKSAFAEIRMHKKIAFIILFLFTVGMICCITGSCSYMSTDVYDWENLMVFGWVLIGAASGIGFFAVICLFRDMYNSQTCDVQHSLPMSAAQRYFSKILALFYIHILPTIVVSLISTLFSIKAVDGEQVNMSSVFILLTLMPAIAMFVDSATIFCTCCCGALAESVYFSLIFIGCISLTPALIWQRLMNEVMEISYGSDMPIFLRIWTLSAFLDEPTAGILLINCLISAALIFAVLFIYKKRDARSTGGPIAFHLFYELMMIFGVFFVYSLSMYSSGAAYSLILVLVIYMVIRIVVSRAKLSFKKIIGWVCKYAVTTVAYIAIIAAIDLTECFGLVDRMPLQNLDGKFINVHYSYSTFEGVDPTYGDIYSYTEIDYSSYDKELNYGSSEEPQSSLTDAQARQIIGIINKYAGGKDKTLDDFLDAFFGNDAYVVNRDSTYDYLSFVIKEANLSEYNNYRYDDKYKEWNLYRIFSRDLFLNKEEANELASELDEFDFIQVEISRTSDIEYYK